MGPGNPLLADAPALFDIGRGALLSGDLESALDAFVDGLEDLEAAVEVARQPGIEESRATAAGALDAIFDAVEILRWREPALALTEDQRKELDKIVAHLGPWPFGFEDTALEGYVTGDFEAGGGHVKQAVKRLEDLIAEGVPVFDITKRLVKEFVELAKACADSMAQRVGPFDEVVAQMNALIAEAEANLNPNFLQGISAALGAIELCPPSALDQPCDVAIEKLPVPTLLFGTGNTPPGAPYGGVPFAADYALLKDPPATPGYFRLRVRDAGQVVAVLDEGQRLPGIYATGWNGLGFSADPMADLFAVEPPELVAVPPGVYEMQYVYFCLMDPSGIHAVQSQFFSIVAEPPSPAGGPLEVLPSYVQFMAEQGGADPAAQTATVSNLGGQTFEWSRTTDAAWLTAAPAGGTLAPGQSENLSLAAHAEGLTPQQLAGSVEISAATPNPGPVANSPQAVTAVLSVVPAGFVPAPGSGVPPGGGPGGPGAPPPGGGIPQVSIALAPLSEAPTVPQESSAARCTVTATPRCENEPGEKITFTFTLPSDNGENAQTIPYLYLVDLGEDAKKILVPPNGPAVVKTIEVQVSVSTLRLHPRGWCKAGADAYFQQPAATAIIEQIKLQKGPHHELRTSIAQLEGDLIDAIEAGLPTGGIVSEISDKEGEDDDVLAVIEGLSVGQTNSIEALLGQPPDADAAMVQLDLRAFEVREDSETLKYKAVPNGGEFSKGWATWLNDDDDDGDGVSDREDGDVGGEDDLSQVWWFFAKPLAPPLGMATFNLSLDVSGPALSFWGQPTKAGAVVELPLSVAALHERRGVFVEALAPSTADLAELVTGKIGIAPDLCEDLLRGTAVAISSVLFESLDGTLQPLRFEQATTPTGSFAIPTTPKSPVIEGGEFRVFPGKFAPNEPLNKVVRIVVEMTPPRFEQVVWVKPFDVDDPSASTAPIDDEAGAQDNRGNVNGRRDGEIARLDGTVADGLGRLDQPVDPFGKAIFNFTVTMQPGDNFRVVAAFSKRSVLQNTFVKRPDVVAKVYSPVFVPGPIPTFGSIALADSADPVPSGRKQSPLLTVWRKLHVERDSMKAPFGTDNGRDGTVGNVVSGFPAGPGFPPSPVSRAFLGIDLEQLDMYEGGRLNAGGTFYDVFNLAPGGPPVLPQFGHVNSQSGGGNDYVMVTVPAGTAVPVPGQEFVLRDDDDNTLLPGLPNISLMEEKFRPAYILPVDDEGGTTGANSTNVPFVRNSDWEPVATGQSVFDLALAHNQSDANRADDFWVVYVLTGFQAGQHMDFDPDDARLRAPDANNDGISEGPGERAAGMRGVTISLGGKVSYVFREAIRDDGIQFFGYAAGEIPTSEALLLVHEVGHQFGIDDRQPGEPDDGGLMHNNDFVPGSGFTRPFSPSDLNDIRTRPNSPGGP